MIEEKNKILEKNFDVKPYSREYESLPGDVKEKLEIFLSEYPVKLGALAKSLGVTVLLSTLPRGVSGQIGKEGDKFVIRINRHEARHRQRFTLAHEIAHYILHKDKIEEAGKWTENVLLRSGQPEDVEFEANRLASDLVIPSNKLKEAANLYANELTTETLEDLAKRFGVSTAAMEIKLQAS